MPVSLKRLPSGTLVLLTRCEVCDSSNAPFGVGVHYRKMLEALEKGDKVTAKRLLGKWYCGTDVRGEGAPK